MLDKPRLRAWARSRQPPTPVESAGVAESLHRFLVGCEVAAVLTYLPLSTEVDLTALPGLLPRLRWYVTRTPQRGWLSVHPYDSPREMHRFGFEQPVVSAPEVPPATIDLVLTPGLAFDRRGGRLGHGAGYYDELLDRMPEAQLVGVTLERLVVERVPQEPHDRSMTWLATEVGVTRCSGSPPAAASEPPVPPPAPPPTSHRPD